MKTILLVLSLLMACACVAVADTYTMTTYYPAPNGRYLSLTTDDLTVNGNIGMSTATIANALIVNGTATLPTFRVAGTTAPGNRIIFQNTSSPAIDIFSIGPKSAANNDFYISTGITLANPYLVVRQADGNIGINTAAPTSRLDVNGNADLRGQTNTAGSLELNSLGSGNREAYIDLHGDDANADYALRIIRENTGANADSIIEHAGTGKLTMKTDAAAPITFVINGTEQARIHSNGNVGIGTGAPVNKLDVAGTAEIDYLVVDPQDAINEGGEIQLKGAGAFSAFQFDNYQGNARISTLAAGKQLQVIGGNIYVDGTGTNYLNGNLGIDNPAPSYPLDVSGTIRAALYLHSSDERLKQDITPLTGAIDKVKALNGVYFRFKKDPAQLHLGLIAQNVEKTIPEVVSAGSDGMKSVEYANLVALLIEAVKEQQVQIDALKKEVADLKNK